MSIHSRLPRLAAMLCVGVLSSAGIALAGSPAQADEGPPPPETTETHCVITVPGPAQLRCFATEAEAEAFTEAHASVMPGKDGSGASSASRSSVAVGGTLIGIEYALPGYLGSSMRVIGLGGPCTTATTNIDYELPDWAAYGFDQRISSFKTRGNCWAKHYDLVNFGGLAVGYQGGQAWINLALDNDTTSERWS